MNARVNPIEFQEASAQGGGQQMQLVRALSSLGDLPELSEHTDMLNVLAEIKKAQTSLESTSSALKERRAKHADKSWWSILDDSETRVRDAQLDMSAAMSELNGQSTKLLLFNTAISKVICDMQGLLLGQQGELDLQTGEIARQNESLLANDLELKKLYSSRDEGARAQDAFAARVTQILVTIDGSQEDVHRRLTDGLVSLGSLRSDVEQMRQETSKSAQAFGSQLAQLQAKARLQGRLVLGTAFSLVASTAIAIAALVQHLAHR
jgi:hypothetical protein